MDYNYYDTQNLTARRIAKQRRMRQKQRRKKLLIRRTIIVIVGILILSLIFFLIFSAYNALFPKADNKEDTQSALSTQPATVMATLPNNKELSFDKPIIPDDKTSVGHYASTNSGVYIYNKTAFELFGGSDYSAKDYADCISEFKNLMGDDVIVYNMVVPNHTEFGLPTRLIDNGNVATDSQSENIKKIYSAYSADVVPINCYNKLSEHNDEYIYFNTDHHWTALGAYYAYEAFCEQTNQTALDLESCTEQTIEDFTGTLFDLDASLNDNIDTVHFWTFPYATYAMCTNDSSSEPYQTTIYYEDEASGNCSYGVFIWGDNPLFVEHNTEIANNKKIAVIKESYGNAFVPYLTSNYEEVHVIDFRYFNENLKSYCEANDIKEVMFLNNVMSANTAIQVDRIRALFG